MQVGASWQTTAGPYVVAAHGGSAASLVASLLAAPVRARHELPPGAAVVLTARTTGDGMDAVLAAAGDLPPGAELAAVVLSGDAPLAPPPRVRGGLRQLDPGVRVLWLPYVPAWRYGPASPSTATGRWRAAARELVAALAVPTAPPQPVDPDPEPDPDGSVALPLMEGVPA